MDITSLCSKDEPFAGDVILTTGALISLGTLRITVFPETEFPLLSRTVAIKFIEVPGSETASSSRTYLQWRIRQSQKGKIPIGPRPKRSSTTGPHKVLPLRMEENLVAELDQARERLGLPSRMALFRSALHAFLLEAGEVRVAEMFAPTTEA